MRRFTSAFVVSLTVGAFIGVVPAVASAQSSPPPPLPSEMPPPPPPTYAQPSPYMTETPTTSPGHMPAPMQAFELTVGTGYTQGFGMLRDNLSVPDVATPGIGFDLGMGYRFNPRLALMAYGQYSELVAERASYVRGLSMSLAVQYHATPTKKTDPWFEIGTGYRFLWEVPSVGPTLEQNGLQLVRARVGFDVRTTPVVAVGPVIGADLNMFLFQDVPGLPTNISNPKLNTFIYAGLQGRFDMGGKSVTEAHAVASAD
jgi:hypothetical protein